jgi:hypothetical protein
MAVYELYIPIRRHAWLIFWKDVRKLTGYWDVL